MRLTSVARGNTMMCASRAVAAALFCLATLASTAGCADGKGESVGNVSRPADSREGNRGAGDRIELPPPRRDGDVSVEEALDRRSSCRAFAGRAPELQSIGQLLWAAMGEGVDAVSGATLTAPSAGAIYPLELYLVTGGEGELPAGVYSYDETSHSLVTVSAGDVRAELASAALGQDFISQAPVSVVMAAEYGKSTARYGDRGIRYAHMDVGCATENLALQAEALGLATVVVGAFNDAEVAEIVGARGTPLAIMPLGYPE